MPSLAECAVVALFSVLSSHSGYASSFIFRPVRSQAFDRHCNMVLENVKEMWTEAPRTGKVSYGYVF
jgi:hypothetical protein